MNVSEMPGLEPLQAMADGRLPHPAMAETIPMRVSEVSRGDVRFTARADRRHLNPLGGTLFAHATCTCAILPRRAAGP